MFLCSVLATLLSLSVVVQATGDSTYSQYAFNFKKSQTCVQCADASTCLQEIRHCVNMTYHSHSVSLLKVFCNPNPDHLWLLLILELQPSAARDGSQYMKGCMTGMIRWGFWFYTECTMDISGADGYKNCSVNSHPLISNPVMHLPAWVSVVIAILAIILFLMIIGILCALCCYCRKKNKFCFRNHVAQNDLGVSSINGESDCLVGRNNQRRFDAERYGSVGENYENPTPRK